MRLPILFLLCLLSAAPASALDTTTRAVGPVISWTEESLERFDPSWVHVKFVEGAAVDLSEGRFARGGVALGAVNAAVGNAVTVRRTFPGDRETFLEWKQRGERASGRPGPDLSLWYDVRLPEGRANLASVINRLNALPEIEIAHPAPVCETAGIWDHGDGPAGGVQVVERTGSGERDALLRGSTPDFSAQQGYLYDTPIGLDAPSAWARPGGRGAGLHFIDVELGWTLSHEDFDSGNQFYQSGVNDPSYVDHGTSVLGEVLGMDNGFGVTGFASDVTWGTVAITVGEWPNVPHYFQDAVDHLSAGDVWLIELQMYPPSRDATPMEWLQVNYDVIWTGCWALDIVCVEAGANGSQNLDDASWGGVFDRDVRDSGAILVGAGTPTGRIAEWFTNYGSRMDVHAWGSQIVTTGYGDLYNGGSMNSEYTATFGGTSGASPMITGSSLCIQGIATASLGQPLTPAALRQLLVDTGIPHLDGAKEIGPRPDLAAAVDGLVDPAGVSGPGETGVARSLVLQSPFARETEIRFRQVVPGEARIEIHDVTGRLVRAIDLSGSGVGERTVRWDGRDSRGREVRSGVYWLRVLTEGAALTGRVVKVI